MRYWPGGDETGFNWAGHFSGSLDRTGTGWRGMGIRLGLSCGDLVVLLALVSAVIYFPFFKVYEKQLLAQEKKKRSV